MTPSPTEPVHRFEAVLEPLTWGRATYTILRVPAALVDAAATWPTRRVAGTIEDAPVNLALNRADGALLAAPFVYAGASLQRRIGLRPGDVAAVALRPVDPDLVPLPRDLRAALLDADLLTAFEARRPAERRRLLVPIEDAAREDTRARRITALVRQVGSGGR